MAKVKETVKSCIQLVLLTILLLEHLVFDFKFECQNIYILKSWLYTALISIVSALLPKHCQDHVNNQAAVASK